MAGFSEDDARRIFARAAERQGADDTPGDELSLAELQAIGEASGIDPAHIAAAAAELRSGGKPAQSDGFLGLPAPVRETRVLPVALSDEAWARIVEDLRTTYGVDGALSDIGRTREWVAGQRAGRDGVRVTARPGPDGTTELQAQYTLESNVRQLRGVVVGGAVAVALVLVGALVLGEPAALLFALATAILAALGIGLPVWDLRRHALRDARAFGPLLDRAELAARTPADEAPRGSDDPELDGLTGRIDLPDTDASTPEARRRTRRRSR